MRVTIVTEWGESLPSYELRRDQPLDRQIDLICQQVKASGNKEKYALFVESTLQYVTESVRAQYLLQILLLVYNLLSSSAFSGYGLGATRRSINLFKITARYHC